jgi:hypothetical protein
MKFSNFGIGLPKVGHEKFKTWPGFAKLFCQKLLLPPKMAPKIEVTQIESCNSCLWPILSLL